jgi:hypothetical protein
MSSVVQMNEARMTEHEVSEVGRGSFRHSVILASLVIRYSSFAHFPHVYFSTSSMVVSPAKMLRKPSWRSVTIQAQSPSVSE